MRIGKNLHPTPSPHEKLFQQTLVSKSIVKYRQTEFHFRNSLHSIKNGWEMINNFFVNGKTDKKFL